MTTNHSNHLKIEIVEDYKYLLSKTLYEVKNLVKKYPELSKKFYFINNTLLENKLKTIHNQIKDNATLQNIINNPKKPDKNNDSRKKGNYNLLVMIYNYIFTYYF